MQEESAVLYFFISNHCLALLHFVFLMFHDNCLYDESVGSDYLTLVIT